MLNAAVMRYLRTLNWFERDEEGQDLVEYALLLGLIALVSVGFITLAGESVAAIWEAISGMLAGVPLG